MSKQVEDAHEPVSFALRHMPLVGEMIERLKGSNFHFGDNVIVFGTQHLMRQSLALCGALNLLGIPFENIVLCGKAYSTHWKSVQQLRKLGVILPEPRTYSFAKSQMQEQVEDLAKLASVVDAKKRRMRDPIILVLDDGGHTLTAVRNLLKPPYRIAGVEQTASGFWQAGIRSVDFPIVDVGASAVKRICEPGLIADASLWRALEWTRRPVVDFRCGVIGLGYIGQSLTNRLLRVGTSLSVFDKRSDAYPNLEKVRARSVRQIFEDCDLIFGCSGSDVTAGTLDGMKFGEKRRGKRLLLSVSSGDTEFFALKENLGRKNKAESREYSENHISDVSGTVAGAEFRIARNGFPINFDNSALSVPLPYIQGTICALVAALCQAHELLLTERGHEGRIQRVMLEHSFQSWLFDRWNKYTHGRVAELAGPEAAKLRNQSFVRQVSRERTDPISVDVGPRLGRARNLWARLTPAYGGIDLIRATARKRVAI